MNVSALLSESLIISLLASLVQYRCVSLVCVAGMAGGRRGQRVGWWLSVGLEPRP